MKLDYTVQELADKFAFAAKKYVADKELEEAAKKRNTEERYDKAYKMMLELKSRVFDDVSILANSIFDYLDVIHEYPTVLGESIYRPCYQHQFLSVGRDYFIYNVCDTERNVYNGNFLAILIEYKTGNIYKARLSSHEHGQNDFANIIRKDQFMSHCTDPKAYVEQCKKEHSFSSHADLDSLDYFSDALEQVPERVEALFKYACAFADTVDGNLAMADYMAKYRK